MRHKETRKIPKPDIVDIRLRGSYGFNVLVRNGQHYMAGTPKTYDDFEA